MEKIKKGIRENKIKFILVISFFLILSITLGTAILTRTLNINGKTKIDKNSWIIYFDEVRKSSDSVESEKDARIVDYGKTRIEFEANLRDIIYVFKTYCTLIVHFRKKSTSYFFL